jgi:catechol 2,3-dioxygenase-like lactoylglutathione lyase family enzyme
MFIGSHVLFYSTDPDKDREFFRDVLQFPSVDAGHGWLIFTLPPAEAAWHPVDAPFGIAHGGHSMIGAIVYLMTDDVDGEVARLGARGVACSPIAEERWGRRTSLRLPSGQELGFYQPSHPTAVKPPA